LRQSGGCAFACLLVAVAIYVITRSVVALN
jgi:hypothetical protein